MLKLNSMVNNWLDRVKSLRVSDNDLNQCLSDIVYSLFKGHGNSTDVNTLSKCIVAILSMEDPIVVENKLLELRGIVDNYFNKKRSINNNDTIFKVR